MNDYQPGIFGVKIRDGFVAVEETNLLEDVSKYDFMLKDCLVESYNGNDRYRVEVMTEIGNEAIINGWHFKEIDLPGNWFGQNSYFCIVDKMGETYKSPKPVLQNMWYDKQPVVIIRETLLEVLKFTENTPSAKYAIILDGFDIPEECEGIDRLYQFTCKVEQYIRAYQEVMSMSDKDDDSDMMEQLKEAFNAQISKCFPFITINIE